MNTLIFTRFPKVQTSQLRSLQLSIEYWQKIYAEAGAEKELAWQLYQDAIDDKQPRAFIDELSTLARMLDDICRDAWQEWQDAKRDLLAINN